MPCAGAEAGWRADVGRGSMRGSGKRECFFGKEGGVTFSGGEPLLQPDFLKEALYLLKQKGYHTAVETSGAAPWDNFRKVTGFCGFVFI